MSHYRPNQPRGRMGDICTSFASMTVSHEDDDDEILHRKLLPLFFQNKYKELDEFILENPETAKLLVAFLDKYCVEGSDPAQLAYTLNIPNMQKNRLTVNAMNNAVHRFVKKFNVPEQYWPNVNRKQKVGTILFLAKEFYDELSICDEDFTDLLIEYAGSDRELQRQLVNIIRTRDTAHAAWFAIQFRWPRNEIPHELIIVIDNGMAAKPRSRYVAPRPKVNPAWYEPIEYIHWKSGLAICGLKDCQPVLPDTIRYIKDPETFVKEMTKISKNTNIMSIDCEWKAVFKSLLPVRLSILQVATEYVVLIVDVLRIAPFMRPAHWNVFLELMSDKHMLKLGFNVKNDYLALANVHECLKDIATSTVNLLDLFDACRGILNKKPQLFPYYYTTYVCPNKGLCTFAELCLGVSLDKRQQFSNWDRRPLRDDQFTYAVADAHCLIDIHRILQMQGRKYGEFDLKRFTDPTAILNNGRGDGQ